MDPFDPKPKDPLERKIQEELINFFKIRDWGVKSTHGNIYQFGFPDLYVCHNRYGTRWVEVKRPVGYRFTPAQLETFRMFAAHGVGVWVLTAAIESEYKKLWLPANWHLYLDIVREGVR